MKLYIGNKIKEKRIEKHLTQDQLGDKMGVARNTISSWERDRTEPTIGELSQLADVLGVKVDYFMSALLIETYYRDMSDNNKKLLIRYAEMLLELQKGSD